MVFSRRFSLFIVFAILFVLLVFGPSRLEYGSTKLSTSSVRTSADESTTGQDVSNGTLGFAKILVINLPSRSDRRDAMTLAGVLTGLSFDWVDGVLGNSIIQKVLPADTVNKNISQGNKGSWRGHMNALRRIVENKHTSALILEDDVDWDIRIKEQMGVFGQASRRYLHAIQSSLHSSPEEPNTTPTANANESKIGAIARDFIPVDDHTIPIASLPDVMIPTTSPFGDGWDVLWLGHCGTDFPPHEAESSPHDIRLSIPDDPTVPIPKHLKAHPFALGDELGRIYPAHTRVVHAASNTICTQAYAVSQQGARKLLWRFGLETFTKGWDLMLRDWCDGQYVSNSTGQAERRPVCVTVQPPLFSHYQPVNGESDIQGQGGGFAREVGSPYVRQSVRLNLGKLVAGAELDSLDDQWPDDDSK